MSHGIQKFSFMTAFGEMKLISIEEFVDQHLRHEMVSDIFRDIVTYRTKPVVATFMNEDFPSQDATHEQVRFSLKDLPIVKVSGIELARYKDNAATELLRKAYRQATFNFIKAEFRTFVLQRPPEFFVKELNMDSVHKLAMRYAENFGKSEFYAIRFWISEFQKFIMVLDDDAFKFYSGHQEVLSAFDMDKHIGIRGLLAETNPHRWILGRYEDETFIKEAHQNTRYG